MQGRVKPVNWNILWKRWLCEWLLCLIVLYFQGFVNGPEEAEEVDPVEQNLRRTIEEEKTKWGLQGNHTTLPTFNTGYMFSCAWQEPANIEHALSTYLLLVILRSAPVI